MGKMGTIHLRDWIMLNCRRYCESFYLNYWVALVEEVGKIEKSQFNELRFFLILITNITTKYGAICNANLGTFNSVISSFAIGKGTR
jgi:hypothetical protein